MIDIQTGIAITTSEPIWERLLGVREFSPTIEPTYEDDPLSVSHRWRVSLQADEEAPGTTTGDQTRRLPGALDVVVPDGAAAVDAHRATQIAQAIAPLNALERRSGNATR
ncbi:hypothetical protein [Glycomyces tenuis]|uniref:hypothetical protein n=1 Tax=Glycomyces tenuis TaxID=58116 RepID=UPI0003FD6ED0|nr:hypothetical protein [Glycomyces tenuis]